MKQMLFLVLNMIILVAMMGTVRSEESESDYFSPTNFVSVKNQAAINLLQKSVEAQEKYHDSIQTWNGIVDMQESMLMSNASIQKLKHLKNSQPFPAVNEQATNQKAGETVFMKRSNRYDFKLSKTLAAISSLYEPTSPVMIQSGHREQVWQEKKQNKIRTLYRDQSLYTKTEWTSGEIQEHFFETEPGERSFVESIFRTHADWNQISSPGNPLFDPRAIYWSGGNRIDLIIRALISQLNDPRYADLIEVAQSRDGHYLSIQKRCRIGETGYVDLRIICDSRLKFLPVYLTNTLKGQVVLNEMTWKYRREGELLAPEKYIIIKRNQKGQLTVQRSFTFAKSQYNAPLSKQDFNLTSLQPQDGDFLVDRVVGKKYVFQNGQPKPVSKF